VVRNYRRAASVSSPSTALRTCTQGKILIACGVPILGIDVGEDFLDLAMLSGDRARLSYHRISLAGIARPVADSLARLITDAVGNDVRGAIALVDSPRTPRDIDCSGGKMTERSNAPAARIIDVTLRALLHARFNGTMRPLSMFPTPLASYFAGCATHHRCKPHLRAIAEELLDLRGAATRGKIAGGTFTRFMLAGFAVFPALEQLGIRTFEAYPDLQMRLWSDSAQLPPKRNRADAMRARRDICARLAIVVGVRNFEVPKSLDEADAAVLVLSAAAAASTQSLIELYCAPEGRFAIAFGAGNFDRA
jgi:hypothetical protein